MKNFIKMLAFSFVLVLFSCSEKENIMNEEKTVLSSQKLLKMAGCSGIEQVSISGNQVTYTLPISGYSNPVFQWSVSSINNTMNIVGSSTSQSVVVSFDVANFQGGEIEVDVYESSNPTGVHCGDVLTLGQGDCPIPDPCDGVTGTIVEDIEACYPASHPYGRYHLNYGGNNSDVTWSVNYGTITSQSGASQVHVAAASLNPFTLTATINTPGGCVKSINKVIYPCDASSGGFGK
jgi:hypothetical protein